LVCEAEGCSTPGKLAACEAIATSSWLAANTGRTPGTAAAPWVAPPAPENSSYSVSSSPGNQRDSTATRHRLTAENGFREGRRGRAVTRRCWAGRAWRAARPVPSPVVGHDDEALVCEDEFVAVVADPPVAAAVGVHGGPAGDRGEAGRAVGAVVDAPAGDGDVPVVAAAVAVPGVDVGAVPVGSGPDPCHVGVALAQRAVGRGDDRPMLGGRHVGRAVRHGVPLACVVGRRGAVTICFCSGITEPQEPLRGSWGQRIQMWFSPARR